MRFSRSGLTCQALIILGFVLTLAAPMAQAAKVKLKKLPDSLDRHGLVVLQLGPTQWNNATVALSPGKNSSAHDGFFIEKLKPGKYTLDSVTRVTGGGSSSFMGTTVTTTNYARLPIQREFTVEAGKITHLGLLYLVHQPGKTNEDGAQVFILPFSNPGPEQGYLQKYYPDLFATLSPDDVIVPDHESVNDKLKDIRKIVYGLYADDGFKLRAKGLDSNNLNLPVLFSESGWAFGDLGIVARPDKNRVTILKNDSVDRLGHVGTLGDAEWFFSQAGGVFHTGGNRLVEAQSIPDGFLASNGFMLGPDSMVLVDNQFNFLLTRDNGQSWSHTTDYSVGKKRVVRVSHSVTGGRAYVIGHDYKLLSKKGRVVVIDRATGQMEPFEAPPKILKKMVAAFETDAGLIVQTEGNTTALHFRRKGEQEWVKNEIMNFFGCEVSVPSPGGERIDAICGFGRLHLVSHDFGQTWYSAQPALSSN